MRSVFSDRSTLAIAAGLAVVAAWILFHPYLGILHDTWFYTGQALARIYPGRFAEDLFFKFGSQDSFSLFSRLHAPLITTLGISGAALCLAIIGQVLWLTGVVHLVLRLTRDNKAALAALLVIAIAPAYYGGLEVFRYGESWAIPRPYAEGLVLHGLALTLAGRRWTGLAVALASLPLHPLITILGLGAWLVLAVLEDRRWLAMIPLGAGLVITGAVLEIGPLGRLFETMDAAWLAPVEGRNRYVFPTLWELKDWAILVLHATAAGAAIAVFSGRIRALMIAALAIAIGGILASVIGGDWLHNVLIIQLQLWRAHWLLAVVAYAGCGMLLVRLWQKSPNAANLTAILVIATLWSTVVGVKLLVLPLALVMVAVEIRHPHPLISARLGPLVSVAVGASVAVFGYVRLRYWFGLTPTYWAEAGVPTINHYDIILFALPAAWLAWRYLRPRPVAIAGLALLVLIAAIALWDRRMPTTRQIEAMAGAPNPFTAELGPDEVVYWRRGLKEVWLLLQRPSYFNAAQGAGILFARDTALAFAARNEQLAPLDDLPKINIWNRSVWAEKSDGTIKPVNAEELSAACTNAPGLDAVILQNGPERNRHAQWRLPVSHVISDDPADILRETTYFLYRCSDWRDSG